VIKHFWKKYQRGEFPSVEKRGRGRFRKVMFGWIPVSKEGMTGKRLFGFLRKP
jgi:hypothetical protein